MSIPRPTPEQAAAADPTTSVWVTANAGTGKTRVLSDRVLRLLLKNVAPEGILCLTFTKAAAVEMTERIERDLAAWAVETEDASLAERLEAVTGAPPDAAMLRLARRLFARTLELPRGLHIMTIHAFCQTILKRFPIEAKVPPHFEVIDDRTAAELMAEARGEVLLASAADPDLAQALQRLIADLADSSIERLMDEALTKRMQLQAAAGTDGTTALLKRLATVLAVDPDQDPAALEAEFCRLGDEREFGLRTAADLLVEDGGKTNTKCGEAIDVWLRADRVGRRAGLADYTSAFLTAKGTPQQTMPTKTWRKDNPHIFAAITAEAERLLTLNAARCAWGAYHRTEAALCVAGALIGRYEDAKAKATALDFDDLIARTANLLADPEQRAWVLYKLDARLEHLLIDEAQDTSPAQWRLVEALIEEFTAGEGAHKSPRTFFVVGDEKQSIYSFQGADLANFRAVRARLKAAAEAGAHRFAERELALSFRTSSAILKAVDACLKLPASCPGIVDGLREVLHAPFRKNDPGFVEVWPLIDPPEAGGDAEPWALPGEAPIRQGGEERAADAIAAAIEGWLAVGEVLPSTRRPIQPSDILILLSRRGRVQELVIRGLKRRGVPVAGADRLDLVRHIAVRDLVALGAAVLLPDDDLNLACLLKSPLIGLDEDALFALCHGRDKETKLVERLRDAAETRGEPFAGAHSTFTRWRGRADYAPPYEFFARILAEGGRKRLVGRLGVDALEPIEAFLGQALAYEEGHPSSLQGFLHWLGLEDQKLKRDPAPARSEVRVMTVHGAKGLEAPVVILADAGPKWREQDNQEYLIFADGLPCWRGGKKGTHPPFVVTACDADAARAAEERMRLLYVALTRAKDRLYIAGWNHKRDTKDAGCWHDLVAEALQRCGPCTEVPLDFEPFDGVTALRFMAGSNTIDAATTPPAATLAMPPLPGWLGPVAKEPPGLFRLSPSNAGDDVPAAAPDAKGALIGRDFGVALHRLLHLLADLPPVERDGALETALAALNRGFDAATLAELARQVGAVLDLPDLAPAFRPGSRGEQPIIGRIGDVLVSGQIDRLAVTDEAVYLVDFKSGRRPPASVEATPKGYLRQLAVYARLLQDIYPGREVRAGLVWSAVPVLVRVPPGLLEAHLPRTLAGAP